MDEERGDSRLADDDDVGDAHQRRTHLRLAFHAHANGVVVEMQDGALGEDVQRVQEFMRRSDLRGPVCGTCSPRTRSGSPATQGMQALINEQFG